MLVKISRKLVGKVENPKFPKDGEFLTPKEMPEKVIVETEEPMKDKQTGLVLPYGTPGVRIGDKLFLFGVPSPNGVIVVSKVVVPKVRVVASGTTVVLTQQ